MKRIIIALCLLPFAVQAMQEGTVTTTDLKLSPLVQLEHTGPSHFTTPIDQRKLSITLVNRDNYQKYKKQMDEFTQLIQASPLLNDMLVKYQHYVLSQRAPWDTEDQKIRKKAELDCHASTERLHRLKEDSYICEQQDKTKKFLSPEYAHDQDACDWQNLEGWKEIINRQKDVIQDLMAAHCVHALVTLQKLKETSSYIEDRQQKLTEKHKIDEPAQP